MNQCPCGSNKLLTECCALYINGLGKAQSPGVLMRSRYTAFTLADANYIKQTMAGKALLGFDEAKTQLWARSVVWLGLDVVNESSDANLGHVEFIARYLENNLLKSIHEVSEFHLINGVWFYVDGKHVPAPNQRIARNDNCPCGSGRKFKNCHSKSK